MGKNFSYRITLDEDNPRHMRVASLLDKLGRGELRQYIVDCIILAEAVTDQQRAVETPDAPAIPYAVKQFPAPQADARAPMPPLTNEQGDEQIDKQAWAQESLKAWGK